MLIAALEQHYNNGMAVWMDGLKSLAFFLKKLRTESKYSTFDRTIGDLFGR